MRALRLKPRIRPRDRLRGSKAQPKRAALDKLCREVVFQRDEGKCRRCHKTTQPQWAHIYSRRFLSVRWNTLNSMVLCAGCHFWVHHNPIEGGEFFKSQLDTGDYASLTIAKNRGVTPDRLTVKLMLEGRIK